jgi:outer membrane protein insertion porin family
MRSEFTPKKLQRDKIYLEAYYKSNGFLNIVITAKYESNSQKYIDIQFDIEEGYQYQLKNINFHGNKLFTHDEIKQIVHISTNENFNPLQIRRELKTLKRKYLMEGKVDIVIMDEVTIDEKNVIARINIFEGSTYQIQNIFITGLLSVKEKYVLREILFKVGEIYNIDKVDESKKRIFNSGLFSNVEILNKLVDKENGLLNIEIKVLEYKSSSIEANFSFTELDFWQENLKPTGVEAQARWVLGNILNTTSNIEFTGKIASDINLNDKPQIKRDFTAIYRTPWTLYFRIPTQIKYFHIEQSEDSELIIDGLTYSLKFDKMNDTRYEFNSTFEIIQSNDSSIIEEDEEPARWMNFIYISNKIKNPLNPVGGQYLSFISTLYGTFLGGDRNFVKFEGEFRKYLRIGNDNIFALRVVVAYINNLETDNDLPDIYKFQLGGQTSLRGWASYID